MSGTLTYLLCALSLGILVALIYQLVFPKGSARRARWFFFWTSVHWLPRVYRHYRRFCRNQQCTPVSFSLFFDKVRKAIVTAMVVKSRRRAGDVATVILRLNKQQNLEVRLNALSQIRLGFSLQPHQEIQYEFTHSGIDTNKLYRCPNDSELPGKNGY